MIGEHNDFSQPRAAMPDVYPMPSFVTLAVRNVPASIAWYRDIFGFQVVMAFGVDFVHLRWIKFADLLLRTGSPGSGKGITISYQTELSRIDSLADRARAAGVQFLSEPSNRPWNARDFTIADPDGYRISFTAGPVDRTLNMADITARLKTPVSV